jgi:histidinol dehydrogenase
MVFWLNQSDEDFEARFQEFLSLKREVSVDVDAAVAEIIDDVRARKHAAVAEYTARFDRLDVSETARFSVAEIDAAAASVGAEDRAALELAIARVQSFHERQRPQDEGYTDDVGVELGWRWTSVSATGIYVPGGQAAYPSSVYMNAIPARVAGVPRIAMCVPTPNGEVNALVLTAAHLCGVTEIYRIGGAQAVAAMAYGTEEVAPVDKIVGPGNAYVAAAKRRVFGQVGIDMIAGPSEILVVADRDNDPAWIAADLLSQAEHDADAQSILITDDYRFAQAVEQAVEAQLKTLPRAEIAGASWQNNGGIILVNDVSACENLVDRLAPEHLEIATEAPKALFGKIRNAGSAFLGRFTPEPIGDYIAGPNHVLPTARAARYASGLGVLDFMKRTTFLGLSPDALAELGAPARRLAEAEGLSAHARSIAIRGNH